MITVASIRPETERERRLQEINNLIVLQMQRERARKRLIRGIIHALAITAWVALVIWIVVG